MEPLVFLPTYPPARNESPGSWVGVKALSFTAWQCHYHDYHCTGQGPGCKQMAPAKGSSKGRVIKRSFRDL